jgi:hypothetical protein
MKRLAVVAVTALAPSIVVAVLASAGNAQQGGGKGQERTIVLIEREDQGTFRFIDNPPRHGVNRRGEPRRLSAGDEFVGSTPVYDAANSKRLGTFYFHCFVILGARSFERSRFLCDGIIKLLDGTLSAHATFRGAENVVGAVTGGTGNYEGANGTLTSEEQRGTTKDTIHLVR